MISYICLILTSFAACFTRKAAFAWFVAMVLGLAIRTDKLGITSVVRDLSLKPEAYTCLLHFFKADSWKLSEIRQCWYRAIRSFIPLLRETERFLLVADGVKQSKEASPSGIGDADQARHDFRTHVGRSRRVGRHDRENGLRPSQSQDP